MKALFTILLVTSVPSVHAEDKPDVDYTVCPVNFRLVTKKVCWTDNNGIQECRTVRGCQPIRRYKA